MKPDIIDVRHLLPSRATGGSSELYSPKEGVIVHYSGFAVNRQADTLEILREYADLHMGDYLGERGIAYHYDVGNDALLRLLRDPRAVLWHCNHWPENASYYAVHMMLGGDQRAWPNQLAALTRLVDWLCEQDGIPRANVKGHQEVSATSCPGTLMTDFVYPYRSGGLSKQMADGFFFSETGHYIGGGFWAYWQRNGGLPIFGYPLSDEQPGVCEDGKTRTVQYFERARFEYWPEDAAQPIKLSRLGADALARVDAA